MHIYLNGKLQRIDNKKDIFNSGLLYGLGVFETISIYNAKPAFLKDHLKRLKGGCMKIGLKYPAVNFREVIARLIKVNKLNKAKCRVVAFKDTKTTGVFISVKPLKQYKDKDYKKGYKAILSSIVRNSKNILCTIKSISYLENMMAYSMAKKNKKNEAIFLNEKGFLTEGSRTNLFFVKRKVFYTPSVKCGLLDGIIRQKIIGIIRRKKMRIKEGNFRLNDLLRSDEAFLTNSLMEVMPLVEVNGRSIGSGKPGALTKRIHELYKEIINYN